jgi:organic hydroperoxide reductase OsmC/OhrA
MKPLPHHYQVRVESGPESRAEISSAGLTPLSSAPPAEFDGPGNLWSPETLFVGTVADCFVLTFKSIASSARFPWSRIYCDGEGILDRAEQALRFTDVRLRVRLEVPADSDPERARRLLEKAEKACLVGNSLRFSPVLEAEIVTEEVPLLTSS